MTKILLFLLFTLMLADGLFPINISFGPGLSLKNTFIYLAFLGIVVDAALSKNRRIEIPSVIVPYALCIFYAIFTWLAVTLVIQYPSYDSLQAMYSLKWGIGEHLLVMLVFFYGVLNARDSLWLIKMMAWVVLVTSVISVLDALNMPDLGLVSERADGRIGGPIGESNQYAVFLGLFLPAAIALAVVERGWRRALAVAGAGMSMVALMLTASRGGVVGVMGGAIMALFFLRRLLPANFIAMSVVALLVGPVVLTGLLVALGYGELLHERFVAQSVGVNMWELSSGRTAGWIVTLAWMMDAPVTLFTGFGWDAHRQLRVWSGPPHNVYVQIFFELGLIGLSLFLVTFGNVLRVARASLSKAGPESYAMIVAFIFGMFAVLIAIFFVDLFQPWLFIWAFIGVAMRLAVAALAGEAGPVEVPVQPQVGSWPRVVGP